MKYNPLFILFLLAMSSAVANKQTNKQTESVILDSEVDNSDNTLEKVVVWSGSFAQEMGTQKLDSIDIERLPTKNGTVTELLRSNPNVQFSQYSDATETQGEIKPENVSFHGERFYNNAWLIDGLSNNDNIHPGADNGEIDNSPSGSTAWSLPASDTQSFWVNSDIIDSIDVYDSNISAKYGQFTGGVIDAKLKDADTETQSGSISYRTTRDSWTKFNIYGETADDRESNREKFEAADQLYYQPRFTKNNYAVNINQPINDSMAVMFSYNRADSKIPYYDSIRELWEDQRRISETFLLKGIYEADGGDTFKLTAMYSPHESKYLRRGVKNGAFTNKGGGWRLNGEWEHFLDNGTMKSYLSYRQTGNKINNQEDAFFAWRTSDNFDWGTAYNSNFGGYGDYSTERQSLTLKQDYQLDPIELGATKNSLSFGWKADFAKASFNRDKDINIYGPSRIDPATVCNDGDPSCETGDQWLRRKTVYPAVDAKVSNNHYALYFEDNIQWNDLEVTPGIRVDYDQYLGNVDAAPRFTASYDIFGDKSTRVFGGVNRYYADSLLTNALRDKIGDYTRYTRSSSVADWQFDRNRVGRRYAADGLDTPYSDELNLGITQRIGDTEWTAKWVNRKGKDQFAYQYESINGERWYTLNNNGHSEADTFTLTGRIMKPIEWKYATLSWDFGASYSKTKSNFETYETRINDLGEYDSDKYIVDGKLIDYGDMPALDYNTPWKAFANVNLEFPQWHLNWSNRLNYTAGYHSWDIDYRVDCSVPEHSGCGDYNGLVTVYDKIKYDSRFTLDWRFSYSPPVGNGNLTVDLDILNVLNSKVEGSGARGNVSYKPGRQFWLGAKYSW